MVTSALVSFIDKPVDENMTCPLHHKESSDIHKHCGSIVGYGMPILVDATECELVDGYVYYIAARVLLTNGRKGCKVGIVKCLLDQVKYFAHRIDYYVTQIHHPDKVQDNRTIHARNKCHGIAKIVFPDTGKVKFKQADSNKDILGYKGKGNVE